MTRNRSIDWLRRESIRPEHRSVQWANVTAEPIAQDHNPETAVELIFRQEKVRAALSQLPPEQREALSLSYYTGYSHSEAAAALQQPLGTVKTRIRLGMQKLRQLLADA